MKERSFLVSFCALLFTTGMLFFVGHLFVIPWLMFHHAYIDNTNGFTISTGSLIPLLIGLMVSFLAEKIYVYKHRQKFD